MKEMCKITHNDYYRICDRVMILSKEVTLDFIVDLFFINDYKTKNKINFHSEYGFYNNDGKYNININRNFNYFLKFNFKKWYNNSVSKSNAVITINNIYFLIFKLDQVLQWFKGDGVNNIFAKKDGKIFIPTMPNPIKINLAYDTYLEFEPCIMNDNEQGVIGVKTFVSSDSACFFMDVNVLFSFYHMIKNFNMYLAAQNMLNYIGRPDNGTNFTDLSNSMINIKNKKVNDNSGFFNITGAKKNSEST